MRDKTVLKDLLCAVYISVLDGWCMPICLSVLILKMILNADFSTISVWEMCLFYRWKFISHVDPDTQLLLAKVTAFLLALCW